MKPPPIAQTLREIENAMERWHLGRDDDAETLRLINEILKKAGLLSFFNRNNSIG